MTRSKAQWRKDLKAKRAGKLGSARAGAAQAIVEHFPWHRAKPQIDKISGYWPIHSELDTRPLFAQLRREGFEVCLPVVDGSTMDFYAWPDDENLLPHSFGTRAPDPKTCAPVSPTIMLCPLLGVDRYGTRLGYGGGYYDRAVCRLRLFHNVQFIGVAFDLQRVESLPREAHDIALDGILTERGFEEFT